MIILGIDPGSACGWALVRMPGYHVLGRGVWTLKQSRYEGAGMKFLRLRAILVDVLAIEEVNLVAIEEVRRHKGVDAAHIYGGILAAIQVVCEERDVDYAAVPVGTWKKIATGKGNASKELVMVATRAHWPDALVEWEQDAADAAWVAVAAGIEIGLEGGSDEV